MGKYDAVVGTLPRLELDADKPAFLEQVQRAKAEFAGLQGPAALAAAYRRLRDEKDRLEEEAVKPLNVRIRALEHLLFAAYEAAGIKSQRLADGLGSVAVDPKISARIVDRQAAIAWLKANGLEELLTVNANTLSALVGDRVLAGEETPDGVEVATYPSVRLGK